MNSVILMGRLTKDPEIRDGNKKVAKYSLAVDRVKEGTDFIGCTCFEKTAEFVEKYLKKGMKILVEGSIRTGNYQNNEGKTVYTTDVIVRNHYFCESKKASDQTEASETPTDDGFLDVSDIDEMGLPFK